MILVGKYKKMIINSGYQSQKFYLGEGKRGRKQEDNLGDLK